MPLGRGGLNVIYKILGKKRDQKMIQPGTKPSFKFLKRKLPFFGKHKQLK